MRRHRFSPKGVQKVPTLTLANTVRLERAELKRKLAAGELALDQALEEDAFQHALVWDVLLWAPGRHARHSKFDRRHAERRATSLFAHIQRSPLTRVEQLTIREREILALAHDRMIGAVR